MQWSAASESINVISVLRAAPTDARRYTLALANAARYFRLRMMYIGPERFIHEDH
jgi:hypothetical protein